MSVFNKQFVDFTKQPMFFGETQNIQRYDVFKYPVFDKLTETQTGYFWRPKEVSLTKDRTDYMNLTDDQKFIFTSNLSYQILLDSIQGRAPGMALLPWCSLPEIEGCVNTWQFFEGIHSRSYTYILQNLYSNPEEIFDKILDNPEILLRADSVCKYYDDFIKYAEQYKVNGFGELRELKRLFYLMLISINILEGIRFYVSFACSFAFGELKLMEGSAKILSLIARDESQHLAITQNILKLYRTQEGDQDFLDIIADSESLVYEMFDQAVEQEKRWAHYLFANGSMIGLNEPLLVQYVEYMANRRMKAIGLKPAYAQKDVNPLPWTTNWLSSGNKQVAPQETENSSYLIGSVKQDITTDTFKGFEL